MEYTLAIPVGVWPTAYAQRVMWWQWNQKLYSDQVRFRARCDSIEDGHVIWVCYLDKYNRGLFWQNDGKSYFATDYYRMLETGKLPPPGYNLLTDCETPTCLAHVKLTPTAEIPVWTNPDATRWARSLEEQVAIRDGREIADRPPYETNSDIPQGNRR